MVAPNLPPLTDLDAWLEARESAVPGLKPGVAAGIVWADPAVRRQTATALVYLHGYTASRGEIAPVPDRVAATLGANLFYARLTGHGVGPEGHRTCTAADWERDALEAVEIGKILGRQVVIMATSTGGTLAAWLVLGPAQVRPAAMVLVSPNLTVQNKATELLLWPGREGILKLLIGPSISFPPVNELNQRFWDCTHHSHSLIPMMELVQRARRLDYRRWSIPTLTFCDPQDPVVNPRVTKRLFSRAQPSVVTVRDWSAAPGDDHHVLAGDALSPQGSGPMVEGTVEFLRRALDL